MCKRWSFGTFFVVLMANSVIYGDDPKSRDASQFQGTWHMISCTLNGKPWVKEELLKEIDIRWVIKGNEIDEKGNFQGFGEPGHVPDSFEINVNAKPKQIDIISQKSGKVAWRGIYEFNEKGLQICRVQVGFPSQRPKLFQAPAGSGHQLLLFEKR